MDVKQVLHMNRGEGETSYARNSLPQRSVILKTKPLIEAALEEFFSAIDKPLECLNIADLACSSGPNSLLPTALILDAVHDIVGSCQRRSAGGSTTMTANWPREFQVFLNDLPGNDFNTVVKAVPSFYEKVREGKGEALGPCFVSATPGSFHGRLFPAKTLHFVYCANSLHWLSQVPPITEDELLRPLNKGEIALGKSSSAAIFDMYLEQFKKDFAAFLASRSQEIVPGGHMILSLVVRRRRDPFAEENYSAWDDLASSFRELATAGMFREEQLESFNLPYYEPHKEELEEIIRAQGSFHVVRLVEEREASRLDSDESCRTIDCSTQANCFRAVIEPLLVNHFGEATAMEELFDRFEDKLSRRETHMVTVLLLSLVRKC